MNDRVIQPIITELGKCKCGRMLYIHGRYKNPGSGTWVYVCTRTESGKFESVGKPGWPE